MVALVLKTRSLTRPSNLLEDNDIHSSERETGFVVPHIKQQASHLFVE